MVCVSRFGVVFASSALLFSAGSALAAAPSMVPVQGRLYANTGVPIDGAHDFKFDLYQVSTGGDPVYTETRTLTVTKGDFVVYLGELAADGGQLLDLSVFRDKASIFLQVTVDATEVISPRFAFGSVPYAGFAQYCGEATKLSGRTASDFYGPSNPVPWSSLTNVPAGFADNVDNDALGGLTCSNGQVAKWAGNGWSCGQDLNTQYTADGTTLQLTGAQFSVKPNGIDTGQIAPNAIGPGQLKNPLTISSLDLSASVKSCGFGASSSGICSCTNAAQHVINGGVSCGGGALAQGSYPLNASTWQCACNAANAGNVCYVTCGNLFPY